MLIGGCIPYHGSSGSVGSRSRPHIQDKLGLGTKYDEEDTPLPQEA